MSDYTSTKIGFVVDSANGTSNSAPQVGQAKGFGPFELIEAQQGEIQHLEKELVEARLTGQHALEVQKLQFQLQLMRWQSNLLGAAVILLLMLFLGVVYGPALQRQAEANRQAVAELFARYNRVTISFDHIDGATTLGECVNNFFDCMPRLIFDHAAQPEITYSSSIAAALHSQRFVPDQGVDPNAYATGTSTAGRLSWLADVNRDDAILGDGVTYMGGGLFKWVRWDFNVSAITIEYFYVKHLRNVHMPLGARLTEGREYFVHGVSYDIDGDVAEIDLELP